MTSILDDRAAGPRSHDAPSLHRYPPFTPRALYGHRSLLVALAAVLLFLAVAAAVENAALLRLWDEPIQRLVEDERSETGNAFFGAVSRLGSTPVILALGAIFAGVTWKRCRAASIAIFAASLARPPLEWSMKEIVGRSRPDLERLVDGTGPSFPSGHVLASVAVWGLLPVLVALFTSRRGLWWVSVGVSVMLVGLIGLSRIYLGVHWFSDVVGGLVVGSFFLLGVEALLKRAHVVQGCDVIFHRP